MHACSCDLSTPLTSAGLLLGAIFWPFSYKRYPQLLSAFPTRYGCFAVAITARKTWQACLEVFDFKLRDDITAPAAPALQTLLREILLVCEAYVVNLQPSG